MPDGKTAASLAHAITQAVAHDPDCAGAGNVAKRRFENAAAGTRESRVACWPGVGDHDQAEECAVIFIVRSVRAVLTGRLSTWGAHHFY